MRSRPVIVFIAFGAAIAGACASFEGSSDPPATDAGVDAGTDAAAPDAGTADAPSEAADAGRFCETVSPDGGKIVYCRDFDAGIGADQQWNESTYVNGSVSLDSTERVSAPTSFRARVEASVPTCAYAQVERDLGDLPAHTRVAFDVRVGGAGTDPTAGSSYFVIGAGACIVIFSANQEKGAAHIQIGAGAQDDVKDMVSSYPRPGIWAHFEASIDRAANRFDVTVDGKPALANGPESLFADCIDATSQLVIWPGIHCELPSPSAREVRIDNILVTSR